MKLLLRIVAIVLFIVFFGFALKNTEETALHFFLGYEFRGPLVLILLGFFAAGAVLGVMAMTPTLMRQRRELARHRKASAVISKVSEELQQKPVQPPQPDAF